MIQETSLTTLAKVVAVCATGPGFFVSGSVLNCLHGMAVIPSVMIVYGALASLYGAIAAGYAGFRRDRWVKEAGAVDWPLIVKKREERIGELYEKIDSLQEKLEREQAISTKLSQHILGERTGGKKKLKEIK